MENQNKISIVYKEYIPKEWIDEFKEKIQKADIHRRGLNG